MKKIILKLLFIYIYINKMLKVGKVNLKILNKETELGNTRLEFKLSGDNINYIIANTIRRTILSDIPIYAFGEFKFEENSSIFHNNYLKLRLQQMPVWSIDNTVEYLDNVEENKMSIIEEEEDKDFDEIQLEIEKKTVSTLKRLTMYISSQNQSNDIITVTTNDAKFYYNEKQIASPYKIPIPIVKLQPKQKIIFSAITKVGCEYDDAMFSAVSICTYKQIKENEFDFIIESRGQISEKRILQVAIININRKIKNFLKLIEEKDFKSNENNGVIIINNEDHTLGNIITRGMQQHEDIAFAGYNLPHPLAKKVYFHYKLEKGNIKKVVKDVINYYEELFTQINKVITNIL
jgi:DNA-directed RNA polymerase subunit L